MRFVWRGNRDDRLQKRKDWLWMNSKASPWLKCCYWFNLRVQLVAMQDPCEGRFPMSCVQVSAVTLFLFRGFDRHAVFGFAATHSCFENCQLAFGFLVFLALNFLIQAVVFLDLFVVAQKQVQDD